jgi:hypothetical protein
MLAYNTRHRYKMNYCSMALILETYRSRKNSSAKRREEQANSSDDVRRHTYPSRLLLSFLVVSTSLGCRNPQKKCNSKVVLTHKQEEKASR